MADHLGSRATSGCFAGQPGQSTVSDAGQSGAQFLSDFCCPTPPPPADDDVNPEMVRPFPRLQVAERKPPRRKGASIIATSTSERKKLQEAKNNREKKSLGSIEEADFSGSCEAKLDGQENKMEPGPDSVPGPESEYDDELMEPAVGDFIVTHLEGSRGTKRSIAQVVGVAGLGRFEVSFLKKGKKSFIFPDPVDKDIIAWYDIVSKLPPPIRGSTSRTAGLLQFPSAASLGVL